MSLRRLSLLALVVATVPFAIAGHLISEAAALGHAGLISMLVAPRHLYLLALGLASFAVLRNIASRFAGPRPAARVEDLLAALPFGGRDPRFIGLTFALQIAFFGFTQVIEGCPVSGGDVVAGLLTALVAAAFGSLLLALCERRIVALVHLFSWVSAKGALVHERPCRPRIARFAGRRGAFLFSIANRPPPLLATI